MLWPGCWRDFNAKLLKCLYASTPPSSNPRKRISPHKMVTIDNPNMDLINFTAKNCHCFTYNLCFFDDRNHIAGREAHLVSHHEELEGVLVHPHGGLVLLHHLVQLKSRVCLLYGVHFRFGRGLENSGGIASSGLRPCWNIIKGKQILRQRLLSLAINDFLVKNGMKSVA